MIKYIDFELTGIKTQDLVTRMYIKNHSYHYINHLFIFSFFDSHAHSKYGSGYEDCNLLLSFHLNQYMTTEVDD